MTMKTSANATIRPALPEEARLISELALRSKGYWGYDQAFMDACLPLLTFSAAYITAHPVFVLEVAGAVVGFYSLLGSESEVELDNLFVDPDAIGRGYGKRLFRHAVATAARLGFRRMVIESDPHAEAFYRAMGAVRCGERLSPISAARRLPLMYVSLAPDNE
ncbi:MAG TPA: GNAT family N-acetyltransferase [Herpetosiphonaceae bacterium]